MTTIVVIILVLIVLAAVAIFFFNQFQTAKDSTDKGSEIGKNQTTKSQCKAWAAGILSMTVTECSECVADYHDIACEAQRRGVSQAQTGPCAPGVCI